MSVVRPNEITPPVGLSPRTAELWLAAMRHRRHADELAASNAGAAKP